MNPTSRTGQVADAVVLPIILPFDRPPPRARGDARYRPCPFSLTDLDSRILSPYIYAFSNSTKRDPGKFYSQSDNQNLHAIKVVVGTSSVDPVYIRYKRF
jgi:hypothetical protein